MTSILDIDLDFFNLLDDPLDRLNDLLDWANRPVDQIVDHHHKSLKYWEQALAKRSLAGPQFILHVDEHHDMLDETRPIQFGNFLYFAMRQWPECLLHLTGTLASASFIPQPPPVQLLPKFPP